MLEELVEKGSEEDVKATGWSRRKAMGLADRARERTQETVRNGERGCVGEREESACALGSAESEWWRNSLEAGAWKRGKGRGSWTDLMIALMLSFLYQNLDRLLSVDGLEHADVADETASRPVRVALGQRGEQLKEDTGRRERPGREGTEVSSSSLLSPLLPPPPSSSSSLSVDSSCPQKQHTLEGAAEDDDHSPVRPCLLSQRQSGSFRSRSPSRSGFLLPPTVDTSPRLPSVAGGYRICSGTFA